MKYLFLILCFSVATLTGQRKSNTSLPIVKAIDAYKHIGEQVEIRDSIYSGKVVNDTIAYFKIGEETSTPSLIMVYIPTHHPGIPFKLDPRIISRYQHRKIYIYGVISGNKNAPQIIVDGISGHIAFPFNEGHR